MILSIVQLRTSWTKWRYKVSYICFIDEDRFDCFVNGEIEEGKKTIFAFDSVVKNLIMSHRSIQDEVKEQLRELADDIEKLLNE